MPENCSLARRWSAWLCFLGSIFVVTGIEARANDPFDLAELPVESVDLPIPSSSDDDPISLDADSKGKFSFGPAELKAAKKHVRYEPLRQIKASIKPTEGGLPPRDTLDNDEIPETSLNAFTDSNGVLTGDQGRPWSYSCYEWEAAATRHLPLLFEEPNLERLGYTYGVCDFAFCEGEPRRGERLQVLASGVHFFGRIPLIPYMAGVRPLTVPVYSFGSDRPGSPVPYRKYLPHYSLRGALYEAGAAVGTAFIIP